MAGSRDAVASDRPGFAASAGDLVAVAGYAVVAGALLVSGTVTGAARVLVAAPLLGFLPGYALVAALFPARGPAGDADDRWAGGPDWVERLSLAFAASLVVLVLSAVALSVLGVPLDAPPLAATAVGVTVAGSGVALLRRYRLPAGDRAAVPLSAWRTEVRAGTREAPTLDAALNVALAVAVVVAASAVAVGLAAPDRGEAYTEVALLDDQGGELVAGNYTTALERGEPANVTLTVENREGAATEYTAVAVLERVRTTGDDAAVLEREELDRRTLAVDDETTAQHELSVSPTMLGDDLRLNVFVYEGDAPSEATRTNADYHLYLWVSVQAPGADADGGEGGDGSQSSARERAASVDARTAGSAAATAPATAAVAPATAAVAPATTAAVPVGAA
jgi:uncharacterized membrane protein